MICPYCNENISEKDIECPSCGEILPIKSSFKISFNKIKTLNIKNNIILIFIILLAVISFVFIYGMDNKVEKKINTVNDIYKSIVKIEYEDTVSENDYIGSGIMFSKDGLILTNNHIVENGNFGTALGKITICIQKEITELPDCSYEGNIIIRNVDKDLAIIKVKDYTSDFYIDLFGEKRITEGSKTKFSNNNFDGSIFGEELKVYGFPGLGGEKITITKGIVSGFDIQNNIKTDAEVNPGNSGGGAFIGNNFLGIPSFLISADTGKISYIISRDTIRAWFYEILTFNPRGDYIISDFSLYNLTFGGNNTDTHSAFPLLVEKFVWIEANLENYEDVIDKCLEIIEIKPDSPLAYHYIGNAFSGLEDYETAITYYEYSYELGRDSVELYINYGTALMELGKYEDALETFNTIISISENNKDISLAYINIALIHYDSGNSERALNNLELAKDFDPENAELSSILDKYGSGEESTKDLFDFTEGGKMCKNSFGDQAYYTGDKSEDGQYYCLCNDGYDFGGENDICLPTNENKVSSEIFKDSETGLMWQIIPLYVSSRYETIDKAEKSTVGGYNDWRVPTIREIKSLYDCYSTKCVPDYNINNKYKSYWTSTDRDVVFYGGKGKVYYKSNEGSSPGHSLDSGGGLRLVRTY